LSEVLEHSPLRLPDVKRLEKGIAGKGIFMKLFPVLQKYMRSVGGSARSLWIVGDPKTGSRILSKQKDAQKSLANTSQAAQAGSPYKQRARAKVTSGKAKRRTLLAKEGRMPLVAEDRGKEDDSESYDPNDEEEEEATNDNEEEEEEEEGTVKPKAATHIVQEHNVVGKDRSEQDVEEQDADMNKNKREHE
jgi:hypothetical protein